MFCTLFVAQSDIGAGDNRWPPDKLWTVDPIDPEAPQRPVTKLAISDTGPSPYPRYVNNEVDISGDDISVDLHIWSCTTWHDKERRENIISRFDLISWSACAQFHSSHRNLPTSDDAPALSPNWWRWWSAGAANLAGQSVHYQSAGGLPHLVDFRK